MPICIDTANPADIVSSAIHSRLELGCYVGGSSHSFHA